jgi:putative oxidoreductase
MPDFKSLWRINLPYGWTLLPLRLLIGTGFLLHGLAKWNRGPAKFGLLLQHTGVPFPFQTAWLVTCLEVFGGAAVLVGLFVTILSIPLIISMLVAILTVQGRFGFSSVNTIGLTPSGPVFGPPGYEINLLYIAGLMALALSGPTALSVDRLLARSHGRKWAQGEMEQT